MCLIDEAEPYTVSKRETRTARKEHRCHECGRKVHAGEQYLHVRGMQDGGYWHTYRACRHCAAAAEWLSVHCGGYMQESVFDDLLYHHEIPSYRSRWLARAIVGMRRGWQRRDGRLMEAPGEPPQVEVTR